MLSFTEWIRLPVDLQWQPSDRLSPLLCQLDGVKWWALFPGWKWLRLHIKVIVYWWIAVFGLTNGPKTRENSIYNDIKQQIVLFDKLKLANAVFLLAVIFMFYHWICNNKKAPPLPPLYLAGMPDFLEKLHNAALRAKNLEVDIHDYAGVIKSGDTNRQPSQERLSGENPHTGGPGQIYAWAAYLALQELHRCVVTCVWTQIETLQPTFLVHCLSCERKLPP